MVKKSFRSVALRRISIAAALMSGLQAFADERAHERNTGKIIETPVTRMRPAVEGNSTYDYENPYPSGCNPDEIVVVVTGLQGTWCAPPCDSTHACSTNFPTPPSWVTEPAAPQCMLQFAGDSQPTRCGLVCDPSAWGPCPPGASCQPISGFGVCVFPDPNPALSQEETILKQRAAEHAGKRDAEPAAAPVHAPRVLARDHTRTPPHALAHTRLATLDMTPLRVHVSADECPTPPALRFSALPWAAREVVLSAVPAHTEALHGPRAVRMHVDADDADAVAAARVSVSADGMRPARDVHVSLSGACVGVEVIVQVPRDVMAASVAMSLAAGQHVRVAACSDGLDNDGDGFIDFPVDRGCVHPWDDAEAHIHAIADGAAPALAWAITPSIGNGTGTQGTFIDQLLYLPQGAGGPSIPVWQDEMSRGIPNATRWFLHDQSEPGSSMSVTWVVNNTVLFFQQGTPAKTLVSSNSSVAVMQSVYPDGFTVQDVLQLNGTSLYISVTVTNGNTDPNAIARVGLPTNFGSLLLGRRVNGVLNASNSGIWRFDSKRAGSIYLGETQCGWYTADVPTDAYPTFGGFFSPIAGYGDASMTIGASTLDAMMSPDAGHNFSVNYFQYAAVQRSPVLQQWHTVVVGPGESHTFTVVFTVGAPANVGVLDCANPGPPLPPPSRDITTAMAVYEPFFEWFYAVHGNTPTFCPTPGSSWINAVDSNFNNSGANFYPGTTLAEILYYNWSATNIPATGMPLYGVWSVAYHSEHMTVNHGNYEFNPVIEAIDPNLDIGCDHSKVNGIMQQFAENANITQVYWFHRPCQDLLVGSSMNVSASVNCFPDGSWNVTLGSFFNNGAVNDLTSDYTQHQLTRADYLLSLGTKGFYMDSYFCDGGLRYIREMYRRHPPSSGSGEGIWLMPEGSIDQRALISHQLPWLSIGNWNPRLSDDFGVLIPTFLPLSSQYQGEIGPSADMDTFTWAYANRKFQGTFLTPFPSTNSTFCGWFNQIHQNYLERMQAYGSAMGCELFAPPTPTCS